MPRKKKEESTKPIIPSSYTLVAADLSLKRPGFCKMKIEKTREEAQIKSIEFLSVDNKGNDKETKSKTRGQILGEILFNFTAFANDLSKDDAVFFVREKQVNTFAGKGGHYSASAKSGVACAVGIVEYASWLCCEKEWEELYPVTIKKLLTGNGKADKDEVAKSLNQYIGVQEYKNDDESDATAVALAWLIQNNQIKQIIQEDFASERTESVI